MFQEVQCNRVVDSDTKYVSNESTLLHSLLGKNRTKTRYIIGATTKNSDISIKKKFFTFFCTDKTIQSATTWPIQPVHTKIST